MCGSGKGNNPLGSIKGWQEWHKKWAADPLGIGLPDLSGNFIAKVGGQKNLDERYAAEKKSADKAQAKRAELAAFAQRQDALPTPGADFINPATEIANRRRKAILDARTSLSPQSGLGANSPLY